MGDDNRRSIALPQKVLSAISHEISSIGPDDDVEIAINDILNIIGEFLGLKLTAAWDEK